MKLRREVVAVALLVAGVLGATACSTGPTGGETASQGRVAAPEKDAYPVTIKDAYGSVTLTSRPHRVATLGWSDQDDVLALGTVPVGAVKVTWGGNAHGSTPWFDAALRRVHGHQPARYDDADGVPFDDIAKLRPDLILATASGISHADYQKLSKIAPVVAFPGKPWQTRWQDSMRMVGQALGRPDEAARLVRSTESAVAATSHRYPQLKGTTFAFTALTPTDLSKIDFYTPSDNRPRFLAALGMRNAPVIERWSRGSDSFYRSVSAERAPQLKAEVVVTYVEAKGDLAKDRKDPLISQIPAFHTGGLVGAANKTASLGLSAPSPLAIPWALKHFVPTVASAAARAKEHATG